MARKRKPRQLSVNEPSIMSRPPVERMFRLHEYIRQGGFHNCRSLGSELGVSAKTIQRDLDFMRDRLLMPIAYDESRHGYYYSQSVENLPGFEVGEGEMVSLLVIQKAMEQYRGTAFERPLRNACAKIAEVLKDKVSISWAEIDEAVSFRKTGVSPVDMAVFDAVGMAVLQSVQLEFGYRKPGATEAELRRVQPYHLGCLESSWYLIGHDLGRGAMRTFALSRMVDVRVTSERFDRAPGFSIKEYLGASFGVFRQAPDEVVETVRVRFDSFAAPHVKERQWHASQRFVELQGGGVEMQMELGNMVEVQRWILGWGAHAVVVAPERLVLQVRASVESMSAVYRAK